MKIELKEIPVREVFEGYKDNEEAGVIGYGGKLNIRPPYQREFIYKEKQREEVIRTIRNRFPLNVMYWAKNGDGTFELLDGQQRTISICQYLAGDYSIKFGDYSYTYHNLTEIEREHLNQYKLMIYICEGTDKEKLDWFKIINIAGEKLTDQELRNAIYTGPWLADAKRYFSKTGCVASKKGDKYLKGTAIRQEILETALEWISDRDNLTIDEYMSRHQHDQNASELWQYYQDVINWVEKIFPPTQYRKEMKGLAWGLFYNKHKDTFYDAVLLAERVKNLMMDDEVTKKPGIYQYLLDKDEKHLNIRSFTDSQKRITYERQNGICVVCGEHYTIEEMEADHITPWHQGGKTNPENCQMLCKKCNRRKSGK